MQFTVGEDDGTEVLVPVIDPDLEREDFTGSPRQSLSSTQDNGNQISPSEPSEYTQHTCGFSPLLSVSEQAGSRQMNTTLLFCYVFVCV